MEDQAFEFDDVTVTVPAPDGAEFNDLQGLADGERHLTWTAGQEAFFMVSAGADLAYTPAALPGDVDSDEPAPLAGAAARRIAYRETKRRPRRIVEGRGSVPEQTIRLVSDLVFVPGEREQLRIGYRVPEDAPEELRTLLARMLDGVKVRRRDG